MTRPATSHVHQPGANGPVASPIDKLQRTVGNETVSRITRRRGTSSLVQRQACPNRDTGEVTQSRSPGGVLPRNVELNMSAQPFTLDIVDFAVNRNTLPPGVTTDPDWEKAMSFIAGDPTMRVAVTGFTDCVGSNSENLSLRRERVRTVINAMPRVVQSKLLFSFTVDTTNFLDTNATSQGRARNRSVRVSFSQLHRTQQPCDLLPRATTLDEYLFLVRCLEQRLNLTAVGDTRTALSVLRQIYYGSAPWSTSRNPVWDYVIPARPWAPGNDPTAALHAPLMSALQQSQVVEGTDIGHILTGIDAMLTPQNVTVRGFQVPLPNEEWATWAGDVGSAAAEWAWDAWFSRTNASTFPAYFTRFASDSDLFGDIDSFAMRAGSSGAAPSAQLMQAIPLQGPLSNALLQYFRISTSALFAARGRRIRNFVEAYGGTVAGTTITNKPALIARLRPSVNVFANLFVFQRSVTPGPNPPPGTGPITPVLNTGIDEMTRRFVDWLESHL